MDFCVPPETDVCVSINFHRAPSGIMNRGMGMPERSPMGPAGEWGMPRATGSPSMMRPAVDSYNSKGMMGGPLVNRCNSVPGARSMLQQQLMEMGTMGQSSPFNCLCGLKWSSASLRYAFLFRLWWDGRGHGAVQPAAVSRQSVAILDRQHDGDGQQVIYPPVHHHHHHYYQSSLYYTSLSRVSQYNFILTWVNPVTLCSAFW